MTPPGRPARRRQGPAKTAPLAESAFARMRADIIRCKLAPGADITEGGLCDLYGMGKAPVRAALARLSQEGLMRAVPRQGYVVAPITLKSVQDMFELRIVIEPAIARMAVERADPELLRRLNVAPGASKSEEAELAFLQSNRDFHLAIAAASGNQRMAAIMEQLLDDMARLLHLGLFARDWRDGSMLAVHESQATQHEDLIRALAERDADAAHQAALHHIEDSRDLVMKALHSQDSLTIGRVAWAAR